MEFIKQLIRDNPELVGVLATTIIWPTITGLVSLGQGWLSKRFPKAWALVQASGLDVPGALKALKGKADEEAKTL